MTVHDSDCSDQGHQSWHVCNKPFTEMKNHIFNITMMDENTKSQQYQQYYKMANSGKSIVILFKQHNNKLVDNQLGRQAVKQPASHRIYKKEK